MSFLIFLAAFSDVQYDCAKVGADNSDDRAFCEAYVKGLQAQQKAQSDLNAIAKRAEAKCLTMFSEQSTVALGMDTLRRDLEARLALLDPLSGGTSANSAEVEGGDSESCMQRQERLIIRDELEQSQLDALRQARLEFETAQLAALKHLKIVQSDSQNFGKWIRMQRTVFSQNEERGKLEKRGALASNSKIALKDCDPRNSDEGVAATSSSNDCAKLARAMAPGKKPLSLTGATITPSLSVGKTGSNIALTFGKTFHRKSIGFYSKTGDTKKIRNLTSWNFSVGVEAEASGGDAGIFTAGSGEDSDLFSLDRLNSNTILKGSVGINFYPTQTVGEFTDARNKLFKRILSACEKSVKSDGDRGLIRCDDETVLLWLYEGKEGKFAQADLLQEYTKLIWQSGANYPEYGFKLDGSFALPRTNFRQFQDANGKFDPSLVVVDDLFGTPNSKATSPEEVQRATFTIGGSAYRHFPKFWENRIEGMTLVGGLNYKRELPDGLDKKKIDVCRTDFDTSVGAVSLSDICKEVLPFKPKLEDSSVLTVESRMGIKQRGIIPKMIFAPQFQYEFRHGDPDDKLRIEFPLYFTSKDDKLSGGFALVRNVDFNDADESKWSFLLRVGTEFSLDGSK